MPRSSILLLTDNATEEHSLRGELEGVGWPLRVVDRESVYAEDLQPTAEETVLLHLPAGANGGLAWCRDLRALYPRCRLCALFDDAGESELAGALDFGADVALRQPVSPGRLNAQLCALARRRPITDSSPGAVVRLDGLAIDPHRRSAHMAGCELDLTDAEFDLLHLLARHAGEVVSREVISQSLRGLPHQAHERFIDLLVVRLRRKVGDEAHHPRWIKAVRGRGYLLVRR